MTHLKNWIKSVMPITALALWLLASSAPMATATGHGVAPAASGTITGTVHCFYGNNNVSGIWVNAVNGNSGWASRTDLGIGTDGVSYSFTLSQSTAYRLHVGCGGNPQSWGTTFYTPYMNGQSYDWICTSRYGCYLS